MEKKIENQPLSKKDSNITRIKDEGLKAFKLNFVCSKAYVK